MESKDNIKVSVIIPVYHVEKYLNSAIDCLLSQTLQEIEFIFVDDGSTDHSGRILETATEHDSRCTVLHKKNGGLSDARNAGMAIAQGEYIGFMDPDDEIVPEMFEKLYQSAVLNQSDLVFCGYKEIFSDSYIMDRTIDLPKKSDDTDLLISAFIHGRYGGYAWNKLYKRRVIQQNEIAFPVGIHLVEDNVFLSKFLQFVKKYSVIQEPLYRYIRRGDSLCARYHDRQFEFYQVGYEAKCNLIHALNERDSGLAEKNDADYLKTCLGIIDQVNGRGNAANLLSRYHSMVGIIKKEEFNKLIDRCGQALTEEEDQRKMRLIKKKRNLMLFMHEFWKMRIVATFHYYFG